MITRLDWLKSLIIFIFFTLQNFCCIAFAPKTTITVVSSWNRNINLKHKQNPQFYSLQNDQQQQVIQDSLKDLQTVMDDAILLYHKIHLDSSFSSIPILIDHHHINHPIPDSTKSINNFDETETELQTLIEELANQINKEVNDDKNHYKLSTIIQNDIYENSHESIQVQRSLDDVRLELDEAVLNFQKLENTSLQTKNDSYSHLIEHSTTIIEHLAIEYHTLSSSQSMHTSYDTTPTDQKHDSHHHLISNSHHRTTTGNNSPITIMTNSSNLVHHYFQSKLSSIQQHYDLVTKVKSLDNQQSNDPTIIKVILDDNLETTSALVKDISISSLNGHESLVGDSIPRVGPKNNDKSNLDHQMITDNDTSSDPGSTKSDTPSIRTESSSTTTESNVEKSSTDANPINNYFMEPITEQSNNKNEEKNVEVVDIAIVGAGIGGLCAGAILNTLYHKKVGIYESHYLPGGCAHAFPITTKVKDDKITFTFDSGPTIVLGCSSKPYNPLRQVLNVVGLGDEVEWIPYQGWGMVEYPFQDDKEQRWKVELGPNLFQNGPLYKFGGQDAVNEFERLRDATKSLVSGAVEIPAMAMRSGDSALIPLLRYLPALVGLIAQGEDVTQGTFGQFLDGPKFVVKNQWLRDWLDALAFSLSGLPASRTSAAAMAYVIYDMHREGAVLDYPKGGLGSVIDALVKGVEQGNNDSRVHLKQHVESIDTSQFGTRVKGLTLRSGKKIIAKEGIICNAPVWSLNRLVKNESARLVLNNSVPLPKERLPRQTWALPDKSKPGRGIIQMTRPKYDEVDKDSLLEKCDTAEMTGSFLHLHLALDARGLDLDSLEAHYTVMDRGLRGDGDTDGPCGELNMIAVSNPCVLDRTLCPDGYIIMHAYGAGNEPYELWKGMDRQSPEYKALKEQRSNVLWRAVESIIPDVRNRVVTSMIGSPLTHERFLRRPQGTYGSATEDYLKDGRTPIKGLRLCGDGIFPGVGVPAVALSGASAANSLVSPLAQWMCLDRLKDKGLL